MEQAPTVTQNDQFTEELLVFLLQIVDLYRKNNKRMFHSADLSEEHIRKDSHHHVRYTIHERSWRRIAQLLYLPLREPALSVVIATDITRRARSVSITAHSRHYRGTTTTRIVQLCKEHNIDFEVTDDK